MKMRGGSTSILQLHMFTSTELKGELVQVLLVMKQVKKSDQLACGFREDFCGPLTGRSLHKKLD
jgi:hypothetical protein